MLKSVTFNDYALLAPLMASLVGCAAGGGDGGEGGGAGLAAGGTGGTTSGALAYRPCAGAQRIGQFSIELAGEVTSVQGNIQDGVVPATVREVQAESGSCKLLRARNLNCDPACGSGFTCGSGGSCVAYPVSKNVGTVTVAGLSAAVSMTPSSNNYYFNKTELPAPAFAVGTAITLTAPGAELPGFSLRGEGIAALATPTTPVTVERGKDLALSWTAGAAGPARLRFLVEVARHGGSGVSIECDGIADSGGFSIPSALVTPLLDAGIEGFPTVTMARRTASSASLAAGCVELQVLSQAVREIAIPGVVSCNEDSECTAPATCGKDLLCK